MSIWGLRAVKQRLDAGHFHCPQCGGQEEYELVRSQRHARGHVIPFVARGEVIEYVECRSCHGTFDPAVLTQPPTRRDAFSVAFGSALMTAMTAVARADGPVSEAELAAMQASMTALSGVVLSRDDARRMVDVDGGDDVASAEHRLAHLEPLLSARGKEAIVRSVLTTALANGRLTPEASAAVSRIARVLGTAPPPLEGNEVEVASARSAP